jgi:hypothetical protein
MTIRTVMMGALGAAAMATCANAGFDTICATFNGVSPGSGGQYSLNSGANWQGYGSAGLFNWTRTSGTYSGAQGNFMSFCTELGEHVSNGSNYCYDVVSLEIAPSSGPMGALKADQVRELFGRYYTPAFGSVLSADAAAAMQLSIWEIVFETSGSLGLGAGSAQFTNDNAAAIALAGTYLASIDGTGPRNNDIVVMSANGVQDQIIPTPGTLALLGLGALATKRRRR